MRTPTLLIALALAVSLAACATNRSSNRGTDVVDAAAAAPATPAAEPDLDGDAADRDPAVALADRLRELGPVYFGFDSALLSPEARDALAAVARDFPAGVSLRISGHADERGTTAYNIALGDRRANAVRDYLVGLGVPARSLTTVSYGKEQPAVEGHGEAAWSRNRRAELELPAAALGAR